KCLIFNVIVLITALTIKRQGCYLFSFFVIVLCCECSDIAVKQGVIFKSDEEKQELIARLNKIYEDDQALRRFAMSVVEERGVGSEEVIELGEKIEQLDSLNLIVVKTVIDKYGWLGSDIVG